MSDRSVRRISHLDLHFHPLKNMIQVKKLQQNDLMKWQSFAKAMLELLTDDIVLFTSEEAHVHL